MPDHVDRVLRLAGATNFRDLGGYAGRDGRAVRWRRLFRSEHLAGLSTDDHATLATLGVTRSFDFRGEAERAATPYRLDGVVQHALSIEPTVMQRMQALLLSGTRVTAPVVEALMQELYRGLVNDQAHRFAALFEHLLQSDAPLVMHCTAGKDRTGVAAALILLALGVPREVVVADYLLSNEHYSRPPPSTTGDLPADALAVVWTVRAGFLHAALQAIDNDHGGVDRYLQGRLGLSDVARSELAARYLQPA